MSWFTPTDILELRSVSEGLLFEQAVLLRADGDGYAEVGDPIASRIFPPGVMKSELRSLAPRLREEGFGAVEVKVSDAAALSIAAKDRLKITTQGDRIFEVIAPLSARTIEIRRKLLVREIHSPERVLYLALRPDGHDGASSTEPMPDSVKVTPYAHITDKPVEAVREGEGEGLEAVNLKQMMASEIARSYLSEVNLERLLYCLIVYSDVSVTAAQARDRVFVRYRFNGSPTLGNYDWARDYPYSVSLVEER